MRLLVNHQLIPIAILPKGISLEQICYEKSQGIAVTLLYLTSLRKIICRNLHLYFFMFYQILFSPQVKRLTIITYKYGNTSCFTSCGTT